MENSTQSNQSNSNNQSSYENLGLQELKDIAKQREIAPEGNKSSKDTWIQALEQDDNLKAISNANKSETNIPLTSENQSKTNNELPAEKFSINEQNVSSQVTLDVDNQNKINDNLSENPSTEAQDYILESIVTPLDQRRVDVDRLEVNLDGQNIFKMRDGNVANSQVTDSQAELIKQALNDPASFEGTVKITNGKQILLHVQDGQVLRDGLNLTKSTTKIEISSSSKDLYEKYSQGLNDRTLDTTKKVAVNALSDGINQEQVKDIIKSQDPGYQDLAASSNENIANKSLDKIVTSASAKVNTRNSQENSENLRKTPALSR